MHVRWRDKVGRGGLGKDGHDSQLFPLTAVHAGRRVLLQAPKRRKDGADEPQPPRLVFVATTFFFGRAICCRPH
jgi:hypothetical protein